MDTLDKKIRHYIYRNFAETASAPTTLKVASHFDISIAATEEVFARLAETHHIALAPGSHSIWMAHPFSAFTTNYVTRINGKEYSGN